MGRFVARDLGRYQFIGTLLHIVHVAPRISSNRFATSLVFVTVYIVPLSFQSKVNKPSESIVTKLHLDFNSINVKLTLNFLSSSFIQTSPQLCALQRLIEQRSQFPIGQRGDHCRSAFLLTESDSGRNILVAAVGLLKEL